MKKRWTVIGLSLGIGAALAALLVHADLNETAQVMAVEQARVAALDTSNIPALERIMADDVTYVHASGKVDTKASYLAAIRSGQLRYVSWTPKGLHVRMTGPDGAVLNGEYAVRVRDSRVQPTPFDIFIFILSVYARREGRWQQIAWQSTRDVAESPAQ
jgi:hypothetical protein